MAYAIVVIAAFIGQRVAIARRIQTVLYSQEFR